MGRQRPLILCSRKQDLRASNSSPICRGFRAWRAASVPDRLESSKNECGFLRWLSRIEQINEAFERLLRQDVKYRFVIDISSLK